MKCDACGGRLIEIDHFGELLTGCIECNQWRSSQLAFIVELSVEDFEALRELKHNGRQAFSSMNSSRAPTEASALLPLPVSQ